MTADTSPRRQRGSTRLPPFSLLALSALVATVGSAALQAQSPPILWTGARILTMEGPELRDGAILVADGKIVAVGSRGSFPVPANATVHNAVGRVIMPGLVCTHSHVGGPSGADRSGPIQPETRVRDSLDARDPGFVKARAGGITTMNVMPGSGHLSSGQTLYLKTREGLTLDQLMLRTPEGLPMGGLKMANGTNSIRAAPFPGTRAKAASLVRQRFLKAQEYGTKVQAAGDDAAKRPARDLGLETLCEVLEGRRVVHHHTHRHDDVLTVLRLAEEFGFRVVLHHVSDAWMIADRIAAAGAPCSIIMLDSPGGKLEAKDIAWENGRALEEAGARIAFHTDAPITDSRLFRRSAALAVRAGMSRRAALEGLTIAGAEMLDLQGRIGSLAPGKDADLVILSGDPLSIDARVLETWIEGRRVFDLSDPKHRLYAEGGYGASTGQSFSTSCCFGPNADPKGVK